MDELAHVAGLDPYEFRKRNISHPRWLGFYSCAHGSVYGPASGDGIDRAHPVWTVHEWLSGTKDRLVRHRVSTAYFVGTDR